MNNEKIYVVTFDSTHFAIKIEKKLKSEGLKVTMIPVPREISASCGLALKFDESDLEVIKDCLKEEEKTMMHLYCVDKTGDEKKAHGLDWR